MILMQKTPESESGGGDTAVCFCMAAALAGLILDEEAMEVVVQRQEAAPLFENCLSLLARTLESLEPQAQVGAAAARKGKQVLFSDYNRSLLRWQPGAAATLRLVSLPCKAAALYAHCMHIAACDVA